MGPHRTCGKNFQLAVFVNSLVYNCIVVNYDAYLYGADPRVRPFISTHVFIYYDAQVGVPTNHGLKSKTNRPLSGVEGNDYPKL